MMGSSFRRIVFCGAACWTLLAGGTSAQAQIIELDAVSGEPFGVGRMTVQLSGPGADGSLLLTERGGRVFYSTYETIRPVRRLLRQLLSVPPRVNVYFLFRGNQPLELTLYASGPYTQRVTPRRDAGAQQQLMRSWWRDYLAPAGDAEYPPDVQNYLKAMLSRRLGLPGVGRDRAQPDEVQSALGLLSGSESLRLELGQDVVLGTVDKGPADRPLPQSIGASALEVVPVVPLAKVAIEPIALHVPEECLYVHFGSFENFQWLNHRLEEWGGDLRNIISERGVDYQLHERMNRQLALHETMLSNIMGPQVIADVALIGTDMFMREGAAMGVLFQARNSAALGSDIRRQRADALKNEQGSSEQMLKIAGREVSFISTPNNALRSFYAVDGDFHLVTTSRYVAERFLQTGRGNRSLGKAAEFTDAHARGVMPAASHNTAVVYLSREFFRNLAGPQYRVEMTRRLRALAEIEAVQLARLAARAEQQPADSIEDLIRGRFLPPQFGQRPDGSRTVLRDDEVFDSLRGARGTFTPVSDVPVANVTSAEAASYTRFASTFAQKWERMDPVQIGVNRTAGKQPGLEHVVIDVQANPLDERHVAFLSQWLGPVSDKRLTPTPGDLVFLEVVMGAKNLSGGDHHLFGALRDADARGDFQINLIGTLLGQPNLRGYLGAWPQPGLLRLIGGASDVPADAAGFSHLRTGVWRRVSDQFTLLSFHPEVLAEVTPQLKFSPAAQPGQIWLHVEDLRTSKLADAINSYGYRRAKGIASGNIRFLHSLIEQLHVPADQCLTTGEAIVGAKLASPLGGSYELRDDRGIKSWTSTALADSPSNDRPPKGYEFPAIKWLRGADAQLRLTKSSLSAHIEADMAAKVESGFKLPAGLNLFGNGAPPQPDKPATPPPELPKPRDAE